MPVPTLWTNYVHTNLDPDANPIYFNGVHHGPQQASPLAAFDRRLPAFLALGVKYLVVPTRLVPTYGSTPAYSDTLITIYDLPGAAGYFDAGADCRLRARSREQVIAVCTRPALLLRHELIFKGWQASVNGKAVPIAAADGLFQSIMLPAGINRIEFSFAPPHILWAWIAFWVAVLLLTARWTGAAAIYWVSRSRKAGSRD